ncbi:MAG: crotonase/enoyl-CoA hydratase family protein [Actinomycetota bacterium]
MGSETFASKVMSISVDNHVATLSLDRAEARNAMGVDFWNDLPKAMAALDHDDDVRVIVIAAEGPHFSVGLDLKEMSGLTSGGGGSEKSSASRAADLRIEIKRLQYAITSVEACSKPVLAAIHGYCIGGGVDLITACDVRYASSDAIFSVREVKMAMVADVGSLQRLPSIIGKGHLRELAYSGKDITAQRAAEIGLVNLVTEVGAVLEATQALAKEIAANPPLAVRGTKAVLATRDEHEISSGLDYVATWNSAQLASNDLIEAVTAFMEKRPPKFTGN